MNHFLSSRLYHFSKRAAASTLALALLALAATGCGSSGGGSSSSTSAASTSAASTSPSQLAPIHGTYSPSIKPSNFVATIDNRYFPLKPGTGLQFKGVRGTTPQTHDEIVTHQTKMIVGIKSTVVRDTVSEHGAAIERTFDYYAQD